MKSNTFKEYGQPIVVLVAICLVMTFILAFVNSITSPIIAENTARSADEARAELLPAAESFEQYTGDLIVVTEGKVYVSDCYIAEGVGMVVTVETSSFGGILTEMIGIDSDGAITGVKVTSHSDTQGLGTKAHDSSYLTQYVGLTSLDSAASIKGESNSSVTYVSGATISSNGVYQGVCAALLQYEAIMGGAN